jgi:hypothetical protein
MTAFNSHRTLSFDLQSETYRIKGFTSTQWHITRLAPGDTGPWVLDLQLLLTERAAYRFNLSAGTPRLFVLCGESSGLPRPAAMTASQDVAAAWLDGEHQVLEVEMPLAVQVWLEAYLTRHGEAPAEGRKKKRKGAGRAREHSE